MEINKVFEKDIAIVKQHLKTKLWRGEAQGVKPAEQMAKWNALVADLCQLHSVEPAKLEVENGDFSPSYNVMTKTIKLNKFSVISLLHELAHHYGSNNEIVPQIYSEGVFKAAYKPARNLVRDERGFLVKPTDSATSSAGSDSSAGDDDEYV